MIYEAMERIKEDDTEIGNNIKGKMSKMMRNYINGSIKFSNIKNSDTNSEETNEKQIV